MKSAFERLIMIEAQKLVKQEVGTEADIKALKDFFDNRRHDQSWQRCAEDSTIYNVGGNRECVKNTSI